MLTTIFTPTYNRAYRLNSLYQSLCQQSDKDFEWIIVDDGSTDNTENLVNLWCSENKLNIRYFKQENGGKHRAINKGVREARGTLFFIVDSDDILPVNSLENIHKHYNIIKDKHGFGGLCGLKAYYNGKTVGGDTDFGILECTNFDIDYKYKIKGDMSEVFYTSVLKEFPFPEIEGEKFCPEILIWNRISKKYLIHYFSEIVYLCEYLEDGLTSKITLIRIKSPIAATTTYAEMVTGPIPFWAKCRAALNYWRFAHHTPDAPKLNPVWQLLKPFSLPLILKDNRLLKAHS